MAIRTILADPMLRLLVAAVVLAAVLPIPAEQSDAAQGLANIGIFLLFLLNGMRVSRSEIGRGLLNWRFILPMVLWVFGAMALAGLGLSKLLAFGLPSLVAVGFLYLGVLPSTVQSATSYTTLANGNVGLSVISAALLNILGVFVSVPIFLLLGGTGEGGVGMETIERIALILLLPFVIGQLVQGWTKDWVVRNKQRVVWLDRLVIALAVYVAFSGAVEQGIWSTLDPAAWGMLGLGIAVFLALGNGGAWLASGALGLPRRDRIAFLFAGAQKSAAVGVPLATILFAREEAGFIVLPLLLYHFFQLVLAAPLASRLASPPHGDADGYSAPTTRS
ncbi:bile acid:sodium symporter family protein [Qipengyuania vesicularis]|uniref:bile acid:sodium symporter family protein n=1 Tax=Qipengyuania vesicularis TaxID=2867232 RepID=UPI001C86E4C4|nr:bile acid:sodium symporter family protein [Qipengyuania vesicularis]MBX7527131.1 bile acid:sodium symporter [Qipengyuania vesicularis]